MMDSFERTANIVSEWITPALENAFADKSDRTVQAAEYSLLAGGKRIRPMLMYCSAGMLGCDLDEVRPFACALELIHTYSLIHDDLPAMDNDDLRRGKPTCHKAFGEDFAILAGDALLNRAYEIMLLRAEYDHNLVKAALNIASLAGIEGMVGGQSIDIGSEGKEIDLDTLYELQRKKTGALIKAAVMTPYFIMFENTNERYEPLNDLSEHLGLAFQIKDDILDFEAEEEQLGKSTGKDLRDNKSTFVTIFGLEKAKAYLKDQTDACYDALSKLDGMGCNTTDFREIVRFMYERDH